MEGAQPSHLQHNFIKAGKNQTLCMNQGATGSYLEQHEFFLKLLDKTFKNDFLCQVVANVEMERKPCTSPATH